MRHLTPDELLEAIEPTSPSASYRAHLESCTVCRDEATHLRAILIATRGVEVPEPSPLFWEHLSQRVSATIAEEPAIKESSSGWLQWPVLVPIAGLALLLIALASAVAPHREARDGASAQVATDLTAAPVDQDLAPAAEAAWTFVSDIIGPLDFETAREAGIATAPGAADEAVLLLTAAEREELVRLLQKELEQPGG